MTNNINARNLALYFLFSFVPKGESILSGEQDLRIKKFEMFKNQKINIDYNNLESQYKQMLYKSVKSLLPDDSKEPIGLFLSGGLDSTIILHCLRKVTDRPIFSVTAVYNLNDEVLKRIRLITKKYNTIHKNIIIDSSSVKELPDILNNFNQPNCDGALTLTNILMRYLQDKVRVVFSGEGDFLLGNSEELYINKLKRRFRKLDKNTKITTKRNLHKFRFFSNFMKSPHEFEFCRHFNHDFISYSKQELMSLFSKSFKGSIENLKFELPKSNLFNLNSPLANDIFLSSYFLVENLNIVTTTLAKKYDLTVAFPFLTQLHYGFANSLKTEYKLRYHSRKAILSMVFKDDIPDEVLTMRVNPTGPNFAKWLLKNKRFLIENIKFLKQIKQLNYSYIIHLIKNIHNKRDSLIPRKIWSLLCLSVWLKSRRIITPNNESIKLKHLTIHFNLSMKCNGNCIMCDRYKNIKENKNQFDKLIGYIKYFDNETVSNIKILGGEPLLELESLYKLITIYTSQGYSISITTNGKLLTPEVIGNLIKCGLKSITISLDSYKEETHDYIRNLQGTYKQCLKAITYIKKNHPDFRININSVVMNVNIDQIIDTIKFVKSIGVNEINLLRLDHHPENFDKIKVSISQLKKLEQNLIKLVTENPKYQNFITYDFFGYGQKCRYLYERIQIEEDGTIYPCEINMFEGIKLDRPLREIIEFDVFQKFLRKMQECDKQCLINPIQI
ncbi:MAG: asparagine synthase-related protein [Nanoarchaeota archaeon]|nr:asparagine synthase-related protein [Nanoarchaeota archaeon]